MKQQQPSDGESDELAIKDPVLDALELLRECAREAQAIATESHHANPRPRLRRWKQYWLPRLSDVFQPDVVGDFRGLSIELGEWYGVDDVVKSVNRLVNATARDLGKRPGEIVRQSNVGPQAPSPESAVEEQEPASAPKPV